MTAPEWKAYADLIAKYGAQLGKYRASYSGASQRRTYVGFTVLMDTLRKLPAGANGAAVQAALSKDCSVDTHGMTPTIDFCKPGVMASFPRIFNTSVTYTTAQDGQYVPYEPGFHNMLALYLKSPVGAVK